MIPVGRVYEVTRYPVKSMAGVATESAVLGWHGFERDRHFAFHRRGDRSDFPWLNASRYPELIRYQPFGQDGSSEEPVPTHVRTPAGIEHELGSEALRNGISEASGMDVELMRLKHGVFDEAPVSVINLATIAGIGRATEMELDRRRFRANIVIETLDGNPFLEDEWVGRTLVFGETEPMAAISVTLRDARCMMINLDPDTAEQDGRVLKTVVKLNANNAGVYGNVLRRGMIHIGQTVNLA